MGWFLEHAYVIPLIPAASFFLILFFGKRMPKKGAEIGIAALGVCFALALATNVQWREYVNDSEHAEQAVHEAEEGAEPATRAHEERGARRGRRRAAEEGRGARGVRGRARSRSRGRGGRTAASSSPPACSSTGPP